MGKQTFPTQAEQEAMIRKADLKIGGNGDGKTLSMLLATRGELDDELVHPFKAMVDAKQHTEACRSWVPHFDYLPESDRWAAYSMFLAGRLHERGYRPGDDPNQPLPLR